MLFGLLIAKWKQTSEKLTKSLSMRLRNHFGIVQGYSSTKLALRVRVGGPSKCGRMQAGRGEGVRSIETFAYKLFKLSN